MFKKALYLLCAAWIITNCACTQEKSGSQPQAGTTGTLTFDGKTEKLSHVFVPLAEGPKGVFNFKLMVVGGANA